MAKQWDEHDELTEDWKKVKQSSRDIENQQRGFGPNFEEIVGLCSKCDSFEYTINDVHQLVFARCGMWNILLSRHKIKECSGFTPKNQLNLSAMFELATIIDITPDKDIGFIPKKKG